jgi:hypothetical protein
VAMPAVTSVANAQARREAKRRWRARPPQLRSNVVLEPDDAPLPRRAPHVVSSAGSPCHTAVSKRTVLVPEIPADCHTPRDLAARDACRHIEHTGTWIVRGHVPAMANRRRCCRRRRCECEAHRAAR